VRFAGETKHRDYLIVYKSPIDNGVCHREGGWWVKSLADAIAVGPLDLRERDTAVKLEQALSKVPIEDLMALMTVPSRAG
jgi:hypothetical protein